jgi:uncharacterized protein YecT (DUF1311 family)
MAHIFKKHHFACDSGYTQLEMSICSAEKADFVDSLMNSLYRKMIRSLDRKIQVETTRLADKRLDSSEHAFAEMQRSHYRSTKQALVQSQIQWKRCREADCELERVGCEGGSACNMIVSIRYVEMTLGRIEVLEEFGLLD